MERSLAYEYKRVIDELTQGMEKAKQLRLHLWSTSPYEAHDVLLQRMISTFEKALLIMKWSGSVAQPYMAASTSAIPEASMSVDGSPGSDDTNKNFRDYHHHVDTSNKRKLQATWTEQVRISLENGLEGPADDGYNWRKYGQKDILGAKYPRSYYRCTYRSVRNCWATKQVQRSDDDPAVFEITYKGMHTCNRSDKAIPPPVSPEKQELKLINSHYHQPEQQNQTLENLRANLQVNTEGLDIKEMPADFSFPSFACHDRENHYIPISALADDSHLSAYSPSFYSPATSESNYFSASNYQMKDHGGAPMQHSGTGIADIISTSTTNSPTGGMEFPIHPVDLVPDFPFNAHGFLT